MIDICPVGLESHLVLNSDRDEAHPKVKSAITGYTERWEDVQSIGFRPRQAHWEAAAQAAQMRAQLQEGVPEWHDFEVVPSGVYLGVPLGRASDDEVWATPFAKWRARADELIRLQMPTVAAAAHYAQSVLPVLLYLAGMYNVPRAVAQLERDALCRLVRLLRLPGSATPIRDQPNLSDCGVAAFPDAESACAAEPAIRSCDRTAVEASLPVAGAWDRRVAPDAVASE